MRKVIKKILDPFIQRIHKQWLKKPRRYTYNDISVVVQPGVFPPFLTLSTKILLDFIEPMQLNGKRFLELGCGCGIISILAAKKGAIVTATDINDTALSALQANSETNRVNLEIQHSDLFKKLENHAFDYIVINPPYYPKNAENAAEEAWFCGENFEYFESLFAQLPRFISAENFVFMILSEDCQLEIIKEIASCNEIVFETALEKKTAGEMNFIFRLASA